MDTRTRDAIFEDCQNLIAGCIKRNFTLLLALRIEIEDVRQELSIRLFQAIENFDSQRSPSIHKYIYYQLQYEILKIRRQHKPHGVKGIPKDERLKVFYLDKPRENGTFYELSVFEDFTNADIEGIFQILPADEKAVTLRKLQGEQIRKKADKQCFERARSRISTYYEQQNYACI